ncbi:hypothetical protein ACFL35_13740 [Candidatus Riflebacteria bacterium]
MKRLKKKRKLLLVFNSRPDFQELGRVLKKQQPLHLCIFPLNTDFSLLKELKTSLQELDISYELIEDAGHLVNKELKVVRETITRWSSDLGNCIVKGTPLKEWLLLKNSMLSTWWLSLLSEKNPFKEKSFFLWAQVRTVKSLLQKNSFSRCLLAIEDRELLASLCRVCRGQDALFRFITLKKERQKGLRGFLNSIGYTGEMAHGLWSGLKLLYRSWQARKITGNYRLPDEKGFLFITYYPAFDKKKAEEGIFESRYFPLITEKLRQHKIPVSWLLFYTPMGNISYPKALAKVQEFRSRGERLILLEEFFNIEDFLRTFCTWLKQGVLLEWLFPYLDRKILCNLPVGPESMAMLKKLWRKTFWGHTSFLGISYYFIFKRIFTEYRNFSHCIYGCEMHAWEKALNAARIDLNIPTRSIAFQNPPISRNFFHFFYTPEETARKETRGGLPLPDIFACNGEASHRNLSSCNFPVLTKVEAIRQLYLGGILRQAVTGKKAKGRMTLMVAGSIDKKETALMLSLVYNALADNPGYRILLKSHPALPMKELGEELGLDLLRPGFIFWEKEIASALKEATAVLVPTSTVSLEALAFGCEVLIPLFPDTMLMNPISDFEEFYHPVSNSGQLIKILGEINKGKRKGSIKKYRAFVKDFLRLDTRLTGWLELLGLNKH